MSTASAFGVRLERAMQDTSRGVLGLVDELLSIASDHGLAMNWQNDLCRIHTLLAEPDEGADFALPQSVFRAVLARVAALCGERTSETVSPHGGEGELKSGVDSPVLHVMFANRPCEQWLRLMPVDSAARAGRSV